jgi:hypothetical protein
VYRTIDDIGTLMPKTATLMPPRLLVAAIRKKCSRLQGYYQAKLKSCPTRLAPEHAVDLTVRIIEIQHIERGKAVLEVQPVLKLDFLGRV